MSKWFATGDDTESSEEEEDDDEEEEEEEEESEEDTPEPSKGVSRFLKKTSGDADGSGADGGGRKVLSHRDRLLKELRQAATQMNNHQKINDCVALNEDLEKMLKLLKGETNLPKVVMAAICGLDVFVKEKDEKQEKGNWKANQAKAFTILRKKVKRLLVEYEQIAEFKKTWDGKDVIDSESEESNDGELSDFDTDDIGQRKEKKEDDEKEWSEEVVQKKLTEWLGARGKKGTNKTEQIEALRRIIAHIPPTLRHLELEALSLMIPAWFDMTQSSATHMPAGPWRNVYTALMNVLDMVQENPHFTVVEGADEVTEAKNSAPAAPSTTPAATEEGEKEERKKITITGNFLSYTERLDEEYIKALQFTDAHTNDYVARLQDEGLLLDCCERVYYYYSTRGMWKHAARVVSRILDHLYYRRQDMHDMMLARQRNPPPEKPKKKKQKEDATIGGGGGAAAESSAEVESPDTTHETSEPVEGGAGDDATGSGDEEGEGEGGDAEEGGSTTRVTTRNRVIEAEQPRSRKPMSAKEQWVCQDLKESVQKCMSIILKYGDEKMKAKALLCHVYHLALHEQFTQARDMILMSHLYEVIGNSSTVFQILFNRVLAQMGLAAFRLGQFKDVHSCLNDLCASQRMREMLAQGYPMQRWGADRKPEQEKQDKMKLCPAHMHINLEVLEAVHLVSAMVLEVPAMAANPYDDRRRIQNKAFSKMINHYSIQIFLGPPENTRDHIYAASQALLKGDWKGCLDFVLQLPCWNLLPDPEHIKSMMEQKIKEEALRSYLLQYSQLYETLMISKLAEKFQLTENKVHSVVSKMIFEEELPASFDQPAGAILVRRSKPSRLQHLAKQMADKAQGLVDHNERLVDARYGGGYKMDKGRNEGGLWGNMNRGWGQGGNQQRRPGGMQHRQGFTQVGRDNNRFGRTNQPWQQAPKRFF